MAAEAEAVASLLISPALSPVLGYIVSRVQQNKFKLFEHLLKVLWWAQKGEHVRSGSQINKRARPRLPSPDPKKRSKK